MTIVNEFVGRNSTTVPDEATMLAETESMPRSELQIELETIAPSEANAANAVQDAMAAAMVVGAELEASNPTDPDAELEMDAPLAMVQWLSHANESGASAPPDVDSETDASSDEDTDSDTEVPFALIPTLSLETEQNAPKSPDEERETDFALLPPMTLDIGFE